MLRCISGWSRSSVVRRVRRADKNWVSPLGWECVTSIEFDRVGAYRNMVSDSVPVAISASHREKSCSATSTGSTVSSSAASASLAIGASVAATSILVSTSSADSAVSSWSTSCLSWLTLILPVVDTGCTYLTLVPIPLSFALPHHINRPYSQETYSHSMVPGGLPVISSTTRLIPS